MATIQTTFQLRRGNASEWTAKNPVLAKGEPGFELDTGKIKYGDGATAWNSLSYSGSDKQGILTAGDYITIENNVISASSEVEVFAAVYGETTFNEVKENVYARKKTIVTLEDGNVALEFNYIDYDNIYFGGMYIYGDRVQFVSTNINSNDEWSEPIYVTINKLTQGDGILINEQNQINVSAASSESFGGLKVNYDSTSKILYLSTED